MLKDDSTNGNYQDVTIQSENPMWQMMWLGGINIRHEAENHGLHGERGGGSIML